MNTTVTTFNPDKPGRTQMFLFIMARNNRYIMVEATDLEKANEMARKNNPGKAIVYEGIITQTIKQQ